MKKQTENIALEIDRYKGQTTLMGLWMLLFVAADVLVFRLQIVAMVICAIMLLVHGVCAHRHWDQIRQAYSRSLTTAQKVVKALLYLVIGYAVLVGLFVPIAPVPKGIIAGIGIILIMRLRLIYRIPKNRKELT